MVQVQDAFLFLLYFSKSMQNCDERIESVDNFEFNISKKGEVLITFTAHTIFGDVVAEKVVNF